MSSTTASGFPYAEDTDTIESFPETSEDLADFLEANVGVIQSGSVSFSITGSPPSGSQVVTFPHVFPGTPHVVISNQSVAIIVGAQLVTESGFTVAAKRVDGGVPATVNATYIARYLP